jgi:hypothetical protein
MSGTSRAELEAYMERHDGIKDLLRDLTEELAYTRPEQPVKILHEKLAAMLGDDHGGPDALAAEALNSATRGATAHKPFVLKMRIEAAGRDGVWCATSPGAVCTPPPTCAPGQTKRRPRWHTCSKVRSLVAFASRCNWALTFESFSAGCGVRLPRRPEGWQEKVEEKCHMQQDQTCASLQEPGISGAARADARPTPSAGQQTERPSATGLDVVKGFVRSIGLDDFVAAQLASMLLQRRPADEKKLPIDPAAISTHIKIYYKVYTNVKECGTAKKDA